MDQEHVEPIILWYLSSFRHEHFDSVAPQLVVQSGIFDIADSVHREMCTACRVSAGTSPSPQHTSISAAHGIKASLTLPQQDGLYPYTLVGRIGRSLIGDEINFAKVVKDAGDGEDVECAECTLLQSVISKILWRSHGVGTHRSCPLRIVVISVDGECGDGDVEVRIFVVDRGEAFHTFSERHWRKQRLLEHHTSKHHILGRMHSREARSCAVHGVTQELKLRVISSHVTPMTKTLSRLTGIGRSPSVYSLNSAMV